MKYARFISHCNRFAVKKVPSDIYTLEFSRQQFVVFFLVEAFRSKEFKLKNLVLGEYLCQMWSCSKIVRIADEVSPYV